MMNQKYNQLITPREEAKPSKQQKESWVKVIGIFDKSTDRPIDQLKYPNEIKEDNDES